jgi:hypothetical protein
MWSQVYNPFGGAVLSTIVAALPIVCLLGLIAFAKMQAHIAAVITLVLSLVIAIFAFGMPSSGSRSGGIRSDDGPLSHRLDHHQRDLSLPAARRERLVPDPAGFGRAVTDNLVAAGDARRRL